MILRTFLPQRCYLRGKFLLHEGRQRPSGRCLPALSLEPQPGRTHENESVCPWWFVYDWLGLEHLPGFGLWRVPALFPQKLQRHRVPSLQCLHADLLRQHGVRWLLPLALLLARRRYEPVWANCLRDAALASAPTCGSPAFTSDQVAAFLLSMPSVSRPRHDVGPLRPANILP